MLGISQQSISTVHVQLFNISFPAQLNEMTGSWTIPLVICGGSFVTGGVILIFLHCYLNHVKSRKPKIISEAELPDLQITRL